MRDMNEPLTGPAARNGIGPRKKRQYYRLREIFRALSSRRDDAEAVKAVYDGRLEAGFREKIMVSVAYENLAPH